MNFILRRSTCERKIEKQKQNRNKNLRYSAERWEINFCVYRFYIRHMSLEYLINKKSINSGFIESIILKSNWRLIPKPNILLRILFLPQTLLWILSRDFCNINLYTFSLKYKFHIDWIASRLTWSTKYISTESHLKIFYIEQCDIVDLI